MNVACLPFSSFSRFLDFMFNTSHLLGSPLITQPVDHLLGLFGQDERIKNKELGNEKETVTAKDWPWIEWIIMIADQAQLSNSFPLFSLSSGRSSFHVISLWWNDTCLRPEQVPDKHSERLENIATTGAESMKIVNSWKRTKWSFERKKRREGTLKKVKLWMVHAWTVTQSSSIFYLSLILVLTIYASHSLPLSLSLSFSTHRLSHTYIHVWTYWNTASFRFKSGFLFVHANGKEEGQRNEYKKEEKTNCIWSSVTNTWATVENQHSMRERERHAVILVREKVVRNNFQFTKKNTRHK